MPRIKSPPLVAATTLLFVFATAACTPDKTDDLPPYPDLASLDSEAGMAYPDTTAFDTTTGTFDTSAPTLERVLQRARLAMADIVSYKSRGTLTFRSSTTGFEEPTRQFNEIASNGNYRLGFEYLDPYDGDVHLSEFRTVGKQSFSIYSDDGWEESSEPRSEPRSVTQASDHFLTMLDENDIQLRSINERTEDGVKVYRLEFSEQFEQLVSGRGYEIGVMTTTLLINKESFRIIAILHDSRRNSYDVSTASEIEPSTHSRWTESFQIMEYYDYNEPVVIEVPDSYVPWSGGAVLSSAISQ